MPILDSFKSDLALEQEASSNSGIHKERTGNSQLIWTETNEQKETIKNRQQGLGHAFLVLFQANRAALKRAISDTSGKNPLSSSVRSLITHVEPIEENSKNESQLLRMQEVYRPLLDKILKKSDDSGKKIAFLLLDWLILDYPYKSVMAQALSTELEPSIDKKRRLAVLMAIEHALHVATTRQSKAKETDTQSKKILEQPATQIGEVNAASFNTYPGSHTLSQWASLLSEIVHNDRAVSAEGISTMTRLTSIAMEVAIEISRILADQCSQEIQLATMTLKPKLVAEIDADEDMTRTCGLYFMQSMTNVEIILHDLHECSLYGNKMASTTMMDILDMISQFNQLQKNSNGRGLPPDTLGKFARSWSTISSTLSQRNSTPSLPLAIEKAHNYLEMKISPYLKLLKTCIIFGQFDSSALMDHVFKTSQDIGSALFALSNALIVGEAPIGKNAAWSIQEIYLAYASKQDLEQFHSQIFATLDKELEISMESAELMAQYVIAFPGSLLPELLKRLPQSNHTIIRNSTDKNGAMFRNSTRVVAVLAEKGFFSSFLSKQDEDQRLLLQNAIVELLLCEEMRIKNMARQIVASLDVVKIIQRLGPKLVSTNTKNRSHAEAILVECMLSQTSDGLLGDGFISFIEYLRSRLRSPSGNEYPRAKSPTQLFLSFQKIVTRSSDYEMEEAERLFHVVKLFGESAPPNLWSCIVERLTLKTYGCSSDQLLIRVWNNLALSIANSLEAMEAVSTSVLHIMESQGTVTEEILEEALESSDESVEDLRLARLSSLLILKTIPSRGFSLTSKMAIDSGNDENSISSRMTRALQTRSENPLEFSFVRTLAKAVMHVMFPDSSLEVIYAGLAKSCNQNSTRIEQIDLEETRSWLFALYDWVLNWNIQSNTLEQNEQAVIWLYQISREFFYKIAAFKSTADGRESDIYKLQLGVVDVLSRILLATAPFYCSSTPNSGLMSKLRKLSRNISCPSAEATIEEIVDDELVESGDDEETSELPKSPQDLFLALLYDVLEAISRPVFESQDTHIGISLCLVNVLIMLWQRLAPAPNPSSSTESPVSETKDSSDSIKLVPTTILDMLTPIISACIVFYFNSIETLSEKTYAQLIQGCFQILYTGVSVSSTADGKTVSGTTKQWIMNVMVMGINCTEFDIAVAALKLLATMSGSRMITRELLTEANLVGIRDGLLQMRKYNGSQQESNAAITSLLDKMWAMVA